MTGRKIVNAVMVAMLCWMAYEAGNFTATAISTMPCEQLRADIQPYVTCMLNAGRLGCRIQVPQLARYHALDDEISRRCAAVRADLPPIELGQ